MAQKHRHDWILTGGHETTAELLRCQLTMLAKTVPTIAIGVFSAAVVAFLYIRSFAPLPFAIPGPAIIVAAIALRAGFWARADAAAMELADIRRALRTAVFLAGFVGFAASAGAAAAVLAYGAPADAWAMLLSIVIGSGIAGASFTMLPVAALGLFAAILPAVLALTLAQGGVAMTGAAVLVIVAGTIMCHALFEQFAVIARMVEQDSALAESARIAAEAERAKGELISRMSHEIRTPMNAMLGMTELLSRSGLDAGQSKYADAIIRSGARLLTVVNDILDYARIEAGELALGSSPFRLEDLMLQPVRAFGAHAATGVEIILRISPDLPEHLIGDPDRIRQVASYMIDNAVKFTSMGHVLVDISGHVDKGLAHLTIRVEDTGPGIDSGRLPHVFEKFSQGEMSPLRVREGAGLGLAIAARLVHLMGGEIGVESEPGDGAAFWFSLTLPVHEVTAITQEIPSRMAGARVLVIDGNRQGSAVLRELLGQWDVEAATVENGRIGLAFVGQSLKLGARIDAVIANANMTDMSLGAFARGLRQVANGRIPMIALDGSSGNAQYFGDTERVVVLPRPAGPSALRDALHRLLAGGRVAPHEAVSLIRRAASGATATEELWTHEAANAAIRRLHRADILVIDDNELTRSTIGRMLTGAGLAFRMAENGRQAIELSSEFRPRLILLDLSMPGMGGVATAIAIRASEASFGYRPAIIALATPGDDQDIGELFDDRIMKPVSPQRLAEKVQHWMKVASVKAA